ncbi:extracellular solute-binding protein [Litorilinea aerophila]|nr:extracellular solute-binding protein [Litorilinea aerophila]MCC9075155.1 extracellular solute-binding protein [Litorilinea aerophila]
MATNSSLTRRQFLAMAGSLSTGVLLAACAPAAEAPADSGAAGAGPETITLVAWFTDRRTINEMTEKEAIPEFEAANPGIKIEMQFVPESELQQKLLTAKAAGNAPDVSSIDETFLDTLTKQEVLLPIPEEVINVREEMGDLTAFLYRLPQGADDGRYYGLPNGVFSSQLYYNATLLDELGYSPEDIPRKWDDFLIWAKDVTAWDGDTLTRSGMAIFANEYSLYEDLRYQIAGPLDGNIFETKDRWRHTDDVGQQAWQFVMDIFKVHRLDSIEEGLVSRERFGAGQAVTLYNWTWFNGFMETQYADVDWGLVLPPTMSGEPIYGRRGPDVGFTVTTQNENHLDASYTFYRYLVSPAYLARYCKLRGIQPSLKAMWDDPEFSEDSGPRWAPIAIKNRPENSVDAGFWPRELVDISNQIVPAIRDEGEDIPTVLQRVEEAGNEFLQANPQWSILSAADYAANPQWLTAAG